jgi:hypothetical protein
MNFNQLRTHAGVNSQKHITKVNKKNKILLRYAIVPDESILDQIISD